MKVAIVHDWLPYIGGAEQVIQSILEVFPGAILYTSIYNKRRMGDFFAGTEVRTSFLDKLPFARTKHGLYLSLMPYAFEQFDLRGFDLVLSSSTSCAKGVLTGTRTLHLCYCNTPMRYAWDFYFDYLYQSKNPMRRGLIHLLMHRIRLWDAVSAARVDGFIANSRNVAARIQKHYRRDAEILYPPVRLPDPQSVPHGHGDYYLVLSRLVPYKRIDLAVEAFNDLKLPLFIAGEGPEEKRLKGMAQDNIRFLGRVSDTEKHRLYAGCKGFVFPGEEDFGITPVEAQGFGKPVIAYGRGGALETVISGRTGLFFSQQSPEALRAAVAQAEQTAFDPAEIMQHAASFSDRVFKQQLLKLIEKKAQEFFGAWDGV